MEKTCSKCRELKVLSEFYKNKNNADGHTHWCKLCHRESGKASYERNKHKDSYRETRQRWRECNKEYVKHKRREKKLEDPRKIMLAAAKHRAKEKGFDFNIELEDIEIPDICPVLRVKLDFESSRQQRYSPSLDRIDSSLGYIKGNVQVISWQANTMKTNATPEELLAFANWIKEIFGG